MVPTIYNWTARCVKWLNPNTFALPPIGSFGNTGKGSLRGPGLFNWDMGVFKNTPQSERFKLQFRAEFFNAINRANFSDPNNSLTGGGFGQIFSDNDPRIGQLALKLVFGSWTRFCDATEVVECNLLDRLRSKKGGLGEAARRLSGSTHPNHADHGAVVVGVSPIRTPQPQQHSLPILPRRHHVLKAIVCFRT